MDFNNNDNDNDNDTGNSFINRIDSELLNCDVTDNIQIDMDKDQLNGNGRNQFEDENENIIKLRRTKNRNNKNSHIITIMDDNDVMNRSHTTTIPNSSSKWSEFSKTCFYWILPDLTRENMKNLSWKIIMYIIMLYFLRKIIIEVKCF